jgi:sugar lactone lactonase YvrE
MDRRRLSRAVILLLVCSGLVRSLVPAGQAAAHEADAAAGTIAAVRFIYHGLGVQPPRKATHRGHLHDPLYSQYDLRTQSGQKASIGFHDGTVIHLNQDTDAVITSPHLTRVTHGEIAEYLAPGSSHVVQTPTASASAIGTTYDVRTTHTGSAIFVVLHGALQVHNSRGAVVVKSNHQTTVAPGKPPTPPSPVDARAVFAWTDGIPTPDLGEDVSLDANGGTIKAFSSQFAPAPAPGAVAHIHDGLLTQGWISGSGSPAGQSVTVGFLGGAAYRIASVIIDPAATDNQPASEDLKDFAVRVSTTDTRPSSFTRVLTGRCKQSATLQRFAFPVAIRARYVQLVVNSNYGDPQHVAIAEWEVAATESLFAQPQGIAFDAHNHLVVADTGANRILQLSASGAILHAWGSRGTGPGQFIRPVAVALDHADDMYVVDSQTARVQKLSPSGKPLASWGGVGYQDGQFGLPRGIAIDASGNIWVSDALGRIQEFSPNGTFMHSIPVDPNITFNGNNLLGSVNQIGGIAFAPNGTLVAADMDERSIVVLKTDGTVVRTFKVSGGSSGIDLGPAAVAVDRNGIIYATNDSTDQVVRIDPTTGPTLVWGGFGSRGGQFHMPTGVAVSATGVLYVADSDQSRIQRFTTAGVFKGSWGKNGTVANTLGQPQGVAADPHGNIYVVDALNGRLQVRSPQGSVAAILGYFGHVTKQNNVALGQFYDPQGIAIDKQGAIYVADTLNARVQILAPRGPIGSFGIRGSGKGQLQLPEGIAVDHTGNIYVTDGNADRIDKFSNNGKFVTSFGSPGSGQGQLHFPSGIAVDSHGDMYVCDADNNRLVKLSPTGTTLWTLGGQVFGRFTLPSDVAVDSHDNVYVASSGGAVQKLSPDGTLLQTYTLPGPEAFAGWVTVAPNGKVYVSNAFFQEIYVFANTGELLGIWS